MDGDENLSEALAAADAADSAIVTAAFSDGISAADEIIDHAREQIDNAQAVAADILRAAMETELGRMIGALQGDISNWQEQLQGVSFDLSQVRQELSDLKATMAATATLAVTAITAEQTEQSLLTPPNSASLSEALDQTAEILPEVVSLPAAVAENPAPARKRRFL